MRSRTTSTSSERGREDAEAVGLKEHGFMQMCAGGGNGGVEALQVARLHNHAVLAGKIEDGVGLLEGGGERLFDEAMDTGREQCGGESLRGMRGGHTDGRGGRHPDGAGRAACIVWKASMLKSAEAFSGGNRVGVDNGERDGQGWPACSSSR